MSLIDITMQDTDEKLTDGSSSCMSSTRGGVGGILRSAAAGARFWCAGVGGTTGAFLGCGRGVKYSAPMGDSICRRDTVQSLNLFNTCEYEIAVSESPFVSVDSSPSKRFVCQLDALHTHPVGPKRGRSIISAACLTSCHWSTIWSACSSHLTLRPCSELYSIDNSNRIAAADLLERQTVRPRPAKSSGSSAPCLLWCFVLVGKQLIPNWVRVRGTNLLGGRACRLRAAGVLW